MAMQQETQSKIDKALQECREHKKDWGDGPWQNEPDRLEFKYIGFDCLAQRNPALGFWCGYVGVPKSHPYFGKNYDEVELDAHGGLTYAGSCQGHICHTADDNEPVWWLGFDCGHSGDLALYRLSSRLKGQGITLHPDGVYRDLTYVRETICSLAEQLSARSGV